VCAGLENLDPRGNYIFACNHTSAFDIPIIFSLLPFWLVSVSKKSVSKIPIFGWLVKLGGSIFVERANSAGSVQSMQESAASLKRSPRSVLLFPEGRRSDDGEIQEFKKGVVLFGMQSGLSVAPVAICGSREIVGRNVSKRMQMIQTCKVVVVVGWPVDLGGVKTGGVDDALAGLQKGGQRVLCACAHARAHMLRVVEVIACTRTRTHVIPSAFFPEYITTMAHTSLSHTHT
jgi:1-acyl-sn-glycerol-3-phosphate acyltransferase